ncbi:hypothetical protein [Hanstruepera ponticola]|uniref:hypothetical protein n=1 Tax=Hanstruepera ponticola TaxID=2042995 RepID=UPI000CF12731|nr:hypothetical protein [Hanstruepera ponticola]
MVAETDGYKDYDDIEVTLNPSVIEMIYPNPSTSEIQIDYKLNGVDSAYLMIIGQYETNGESNNYILEPDSAQTVINISNYLQGFYTIALVCDGTIVDVKTLLKN